MEDGAGCDILLVQGDLTTTGCKYLAKNADLPANDVQYMTTMPPTDPVTGESVKCSFISVPQVAHTYGWVGSQTAMFWGVEMGANECGLVVGSVALFSKLRDLSDKTRRLIDTDLNRLALERCATAYDAVQVVSALISKYGQGGPMSLSDADGDSYDSAYIFTDRQESWLLESAEYFWVARRITEQWFTLSNQMTIGDEYDLIHPDAEQECINRGLWKSDTSKFNWSSAVGSTRQEWKSMQRKCGGEKFVEARIASSPKGLLSFDDVVGFLRDHESGICLPIGGRAATVSSIVSIIPPLSAPKTPPLHFFTVTADPSRSFMKPFVLNTNTDYHLDSRPDISGEQSGNPPDDPGHCLYKYHRKWVLMNKNQDRTSALIDKMREWEKQIVEEYESVARVGEDFMGGETLWSKYVLMELDLYKRCETQA